MPSYKVCYMNARGRAEILRLTLVMAGLEFEDYRFTSEEWQAKLKAEAPFGLMPWLEIDGRKMGQSMACARYIARQHGMMGSNDLETAQVDAVCDGFTDVLEHLVRTFTAKSDEDKKTATEKMSGLLKRIEDELKKNNGGKGYFVGNKVTLADLRGFAIMETLMLTSAKETSAQVPLLAAHYERMRKLPQIVAWHARRPQTEF